MNELLPIITTDRFLGDLIAAEALCCKKFTNLDGSYQDMSEAVIFMLACTSPTFGSNAKYIIG